MTVYLLPFEKMHGLGNDFVFVERRHLPRDVDDVALAKILCDRHFGVGADGLIVVDFSDTEESDFMWDYYNSDGSIAEMCGNGMRCFAKYVFERGLTEEPTFKVETKAGIIVPTIRNDGNITVNMGTPLLPEIIKENIAVDDIKFDFTYIEIGNPHCVIFTDKLIDDKSFYKYGPLIEKHKIFPKGVNVEFAYIQARDYINLKVWERGCGPTLACGTGACATLVAASLNNLTDSLSTLKLPGGQLFVEWDKNKNIVLKTGPADFVFAGQFNLNPSLVIKQKI